MLAQTSTLVYWFFMQRARWSFFAATLILVGCSSEPAAEETLTGDPTAVLGFPHYQASDRFPIENCCTLQLGSGPRAKPEQGIDSAIYEVSGSGFQLGIVFGPYDGGLPGAGYNLIEKRTIDGVEFETFIWEGQAQPPPEGRLLWLARVGGGKIKGTHHTPWTLRIRSTCTTKAGCDTSTTLVNSIRF
jgi:hypothetical protein